MPRIYRTLLPFLSLALLPLAARQSGGARPIGDVLDRIALQETRLTEKLRSHSVILETYIQELPDAESENILRDHYFLGRLNFSKTLTYTAMAAHTNRQPARFPFLKSGPSIFAPAGFGQMALLDADGFDRTRYEMEYAHREFLGEIRCLVFDVAPRDKRAVGKFIGRIWVEDRDDHVVRFNGTYTNSSSTRLYFHFDSWRVYREPDEWAPAFIYVEETQAPAKPGRPSTPRFKAQTRFWGYDQSPAFRLSEFAAVAVESERPIEDRSAESAITPLESQRSWERQAEANILERLEKSGLVAPAGPVDQVLNTVVNNLIVTSNLNVDVKCRVLLTTPLETFSIGQTIVISRGLLDVLPDEASLAMALSAELAHIALGHPTDTRFAFSDRILSSDGELLRRLRLTKPEAELQAAGEKAVSMLAASPYADKLAGAGLFLKALAERVPFLPALIQANLGSQWASGKNLLRLAPLAAKAPDLEAGKLEQIAALPLGSRVRLDPWTNRIELAKSKPVSLLSPRDKLPFEITPFMIYLSRAAAPKEQDPGIRNPPVQRR